MLSGGDFLQFGKQLPGDRGESFGGRAVIGGGRTCRRRTPRAGSATAAGGRGTARPAASPTPPRRPGRTGRWSRRNAGIGKPAIFSMMPSTGTLVLPNRSIARVASISDRSCGVETITAPAGRDFWTSDSCTSPVPGGRSTRMISASPQSPSISWFSALRRHRPAPGQRRVRRDTSWPTDSSLTPCASTGISLSFSACGFSRRAEQGRLRRAVNVGVDHSDLLAHPRQRDGQVGGKRRLADPALARSDGDEGSPRLGRGQRNPRLADTRQRPAPPPSAWPPAPSARHRVKPAGVGDDRGNVADQPPRPDPSGIGQLVQGAQAVRR